MLVSILEVFDDLGLDVQQARVACADTFCLEAFGGEVRSSSTVRSIRT